MTPTAVHIRPGLRLPDITLPATDGPAICLAAQKGRSVVAIYPWTGRPGLPNPPDWDTIEGAHGSTPELEGFRDLAPSFAAANVGLFALSRQTTEYQRELAARLRLSFPILSDVEGQFSASLDFPSFTTGGEICLKRLTLLICNGSIQHVFFPVKDPVRHASEVLVALQSESSSASSTE